jgi:hypothetical protein
MAAAMMVVRWSGPYRFDDACEEEGAGLYLCWGRNRLGAAPAEAKLLYCGISAATAGVGSRISQHAGREFDHASNDWWVGRVWLPTRSTKKHLEAAEWMVVRFTGTEHNWSKTRSKPKFAAYLVNEWFSAKGKVRLNHVGVAQVVADVLGWDPHTNHLRAAPSLRLTDG